MTELNDYNLAVGDEVRYRRKDRGNWHYGTARGINKDGSITVGSLHGMRALMPEHLEAKRTGPRGGTVWQAIVPETTSSRK